MEDKDAEDALTALLARVNDDDSSTADAAVELYLARFGDNRDAKAAALSRLVHALATLSADEDEAAPHARTQANSRTRRAGPK